MKNRENAPTSRATALITGASSGIGRELATIFAKQGYDLILVARDKKRLGEEARLLQSFGSTVKIITRDLALPASPREIFEEVQSSSIRVDVLVNGAGLGAYGLFSETSLEDELGMLQVNVLALTQLTKLFLKEMLKHDSGKILNIASTAAFQPGPLMAVYYASKAYVLLFSEAIANEVRGTGVSVTVLCPGPTATEFHKRAGMGDSKNLNGKILKVMDPAGVARAGYEGLMKNKTVVIPGMRNKIVAASVRFAPRDMVTTIARKFQDMRHKR